MPVFEYRALQADGAFAEGRLEAAGRQEAFRQMEGLGLRPVSLNETKTQAASNGNGAVAKSTRIAFGSKSNRVSAKALENFTRLLSSLLAAGVPLSRALVILFKEASNPAETAQWK